MKTRGTGKTTIAINLAIWLSQQGHKILLIETDKDLPATLYTRAREKRLNGKTEYAFVKLTLEDFPNLLPDLISKYDHIVIDLDSQQDVTEAAAYHHPDAIIIPILPWANSLSSVNSLKQALKTISSINAIFRAYLFINMANQQGASEKDVRKELATMENITVLKCHISYNRSFKDAVVNGFDPDQDANNELISLFKEIQAELKVELPKADGNVKESRRINIELTDEEREMIRQLRSARPNPSRSQKKRLAISLHDWIIEAIQEKIQRDYKTLF